MLILISKICGLNPFDDKPHRRIRGIVEMAPSRRASSFARLQATQAKDRSRPGGEAASQRQAKRKTSRVTCKEAYVIGAGSVRESDPSAHKKRRSQCSVFLESKLIVGFLERATNWVNAELARVGRPVGRVVETCLTCGSTVVSWVGSTKLVVDRNTSSLGNAPAVDGLESGIGWNNQGGRSTVLPVVVLAVPRMLLHLVLVPLVSQLSFDTVSAVRVKRTWAHSIPGCVTQAVNRVGIAGSRVNTVGPYFANSARTQSNVAWAMRCTRMERRFRSWIGC